MRFLPLFILGSALLNTIAKKVEPEITESSHSCKEQELIEPRPHAYNYNADEGSVTSVTVGLYHDDATPELCGVERRRLRKPPLKPQNHMQDEFQFFAAMYKSHSEDHTCTTSKKHEKMCTAGDNMGDMCGTEEIKICCDENGVAKLDIYNSDNRYEGTSDLVEELELEECPKSKIGNKKSCNVCHFEYEFDCSEGVSACIGVEDDLYEPNDSMKTATKVGGTYWGGYNLFLCSGNSDWYEFDASTVAPEVDENGVESYYLEVTAWIAGASECNTGEKCCGDPPHLPISLSNTIILELWVPNGCDGNDGPTLLKRAWDTWNSDWTWSDRGYARFTWMKNFCGSDKFYLHVYGPPEAHFEYNVSLQLESFGDGDSPCYCDCEDEEDEEEEEEEEDEGRV